MLPRSPAFLWLIRTLHDDLRPSAQRPKLTPGPDPPDGKTWRELTEAPSRCRHYATTGSAAIPRPGGHDWKLCAHPRGPGGAPTRPSVDRRRGSLLKVVNSPRKEVCRRSPHLFDQLEYQTVGSEDPRQQAANGAFSHLRRAIGVVHNCGRTCGTSASSENKNSIELSRRGSHRCRTMKQKRFGGPSRVLSVPNFNQEHGEDFSKTLVLLISLMTL